jgi:hypothetical protein
MDKGAVLQQKRAQDDCRQSTHKLAVISGHYQEKSEIQPANIQIDRLCAPGHTTEMYCASCEVRTEFIYVM